MVGDTDGSLAAWPGRRRLRRVRPGHRRPDRSRRQPGSRSIERRRPQRLLLGAEGATAVDVDTRQATPVDSSTTTRTATMSTLVDAQDSTYLGYDRRAMRSPTQRQAIGDPRLRSTDVVSPVTGRPLGRRPALSCHRPGSSTVDDACRAPPRRAADRRRTSPTPTQWLDDDTVALLTVRPRTQPLPAAHVHRRRARLRRGRAGPRRGDGGRRGNGASVRAAHRQCGTTPYPHG